MSDKREFRIHQNGKGKVEVTANVSEEAYIGPNVLVLDTSIIFGKTIITGKSVIRNKSHIRHAVVSGESVVDDSFVEGAKIVSSWLTKETKIRGFDIEVVGSKTCANDIIGCNILVKNTELPVDVYIPSNAYITDHSDIICGNTDYKWMACPTKDKTILFKFGCKDYILEHWKDNLESIVDENIGDPLEISYYINQIDALIKFIETYYKNWKPGKER